MVFTNRYGEKKLFPDQQLSDTPGTRGYVNLLKQQNHIWNSRCDWSHHLVTFMIIHCHSPRTTCFLQKPNKCVERGCGGNQPPCILQVLDAAANHCNTSRNSHWFRFTLILCRGSSSGFHLAFPTTLHRAGKQCGASAGCWVFLF